jgi:hypothetical protein
MRTVPALLAAAVALVAGCAQRPMDTDTGRLEVISWRAAIERVDHADSLTAPAGMVGSLVVRPASNAITTMATLVLSNATPYASYPWHIHAGGCGSQGGIVGPTDAYTPITIGAAGRGEATVTLPFSTPTAGSFSVNVHKSETELGTIVACGPLTMEASPMR